MGRCRAPCTWGVTFLQTSSELGGYPCLILDRTDLELAFFFDLEQPMLFVMQLIGRDDSLGNAINDLRQECARTNDVKGDCTTQSH